MNTKVEEAFKVLDEQHDDYLQAGEYSGEGCWFGNNFAADYAKEYAAARTTLATHIAQQDATIARLERDRESARAFFPEISSGIGMVKMAAMSGDLAAVQKAAEEMSTACGHYRTALKDSP